MRFAYAALNLCLDLQEDKITCLVLEQPKLFYEMVADIHAQIDGSSGMVAFSNHNEVLQPSKAVVLLTQFIPFEVNSKPLLNALYAKLKKASQSEEMFMQTHELFGNMETYLSALSEKFESDLTWNAPEDITGILKAASVRFYDEQQTLAEQILDYMLIYREHIGERLFVTVNLRSYLGNQETQALFRSVLLHKMQLLCIENKAYAPLPEMHTVIVDEDYCVI